MTIVIAEDGVSSSAASWPTPPTAESSSEQGDAQDRQRRTGSPSASGPHTTARGPGQRNDRNAAILGERPRPGGVGVVTVVKSRAVYHRLGRWPFGPATAIRRRRGPRCDQRSGSGPDLDLRRRRHDLEERLAADERDLAPRRRLMIVGAALLAFDQVAWTTRALAEHQGLARRPGS